MLADTFSAYSIPPHIIRNWHVINEKPVGYRQKHEFINIISTKVSSYQMYKVLYTFVLQKTFTVVSS